MEEIRPPEMYRLSISLHLAVKEGSVVLVTSLLQLGANVNEKNCTKQTTLHLACHIVENFKETKSRMIVELLLKSRAEVNVQDENGRTPLHEACLNNKQRCVEALLRHGAQISVIDFAGRTPLHDTFMHWKGIRSKIIFRILMASFTPKCCMENRPQHWAYNHKDEDILDVVNLQDNNGLTALHLASQRIDKELVCLLLQKGAQVGIKDNKGKTALHFAGEFHCHAVINVLVDYGAYVNAKDFSGNTPLHLACSLFQSFGSFSLNDQTVENLLCRGGKVSEKNLRQKTPIQNLHKHWPPTRSENGSLGPLSCFYDEDERKKIVSEKIFIKHVIMMRTLKRHVNLDITWKSKPAVIDKIKTQCSKEIEDIKCTKIVKDVTLYKVLSHTNQSYRLSSYELLLIGNYLIYPDVMKRFPLYGKTLKTAFQRSKLLTLVVQSIYSDRRKSMVKKLPYKMTEHLMTFLSNEDLSNFLTSE